MLEKQNRPIAYGLTFAMMFLSGYLGSMGVRNIIEGQFTPMNYFLVGLGGIGCTIGLIAATALWMETRSFSTIKEALENDVEAAKEGEITPAMWRIIVSAAFTITFVYLFIIFHKWQAYWDWKLFNMPVWVVMILAIVLTRVAITYTPWYSDRYRDVPVWFFVAFATGFVIAVSAIYATEDVRHISPSYRSSDNTYNYYHNYWYNSGGYYTTDGSDDSTSSGIEVDSDSFKNMGEAICCIIIAAFFAFLLIGSWFVGSVWVVAGAIFLTFMWSDAWQEAQLE